MPLINSYWLDNPKAPYAIFLSLIQQYLHPESYDLAELQELATRHDIEHFDTFKKEFRQVIADPAILPAGALFTAAAYEDGTDEAFLARLWDELYGDESPTATNGNKS